MSDVSSDAVITSLNLNENRRATLSVTHGPKRIIATAASIITLLSSTFFVFIVILDVITKAPSKLRPDSFDETTRCEEQPIVG